MINDDEILHRGLYEGEGGRRRVLMDHDTWIGMGNPPAVRNSRQMRQIIESETKEVAA